MSRDIALPPPALVFRATAIAEACSWAGLLAGMLVKYVVVGDDIGVKVFGPIHGALFVVYLAVTLWAGRALRWDLRTVVLALVASIPPLATLWFERWARRTGRLATAQVPGSGASRSGASRSRASGSSAR